MLGDVHTICGYLIAKYLYEVNLSKSAPNSTRILPQSRFHLPSSSLSPLSASSAGSEAAKFLCGGKLEQKYLLCGMILSNLPDLDVLLTPFFGGFHQFHRTLTHSIYGNAVIIPLAGYGVYRFLGLRGGHALRHCMKLALLSISSHLVTDYITNYGTALFYPFSKRSYTFGVITVLDFSTVLYFYAMFTVSRHGWMRQATLMRYGLLLFVVLMVWKRACLCEVYSKQFHFMERQRKGNCKIWLQPNNFKNGKFSVMKYNPKTNLVLELKSIKVSSYLSLVHYIGELLHVKGNDMRRVKMSESLGAFQGMCAPKEFFPSLRRTNHDLLKQIVKSSLPTVSLMAVYHLTYLVLYLRKKLLLKRSGSGGGSQAA